MGTYWDDIRYALRQVGKLPAPTTFPPTLRLPWNQ